MSVKPSWALVCRCAMWTVVFEFAVLVFVFWFSNVIHLCLCANILVKSALSVGLVGRCFQHFSHGGTAYFPGIDFIVWSQAHAQCCRFYLFWGNVAGEPPSIFPETIESRSAKLWRTLRTDHEKGGGNPHIRVGESIQHSTHCFCSGNPALAIATEHPTHTLTNITRATPVSMSPPRRQHPRMEEVGRDRGHFWCCWFVACCSFVEPNRTASNDDDAASHHCTHNFKDTFVTVSFFIIFFKLDSRTRGSNWEWHLSNNCVNNIWWEILATWWNPSQLNPKNKKTLTRTMPTSSLLVFEMMVFRNSIRSGTEILLSMTKIPHDDILEGLYELRIRESEKLKTVLELYDLEINQIKLEPDYHRLKTMVKRSIEQEIRNKNFGVRNGNYERSAVRSRIRGQNSAYKEILEIVGNGSSTGSVLEETIVVSVTIPISVERWLSSTLVTIAPNALVFAQVSLKQARHTTFNIWHGSGTFPERIDEQIVDDFFKFEMSLEAVLASAAASKNRVSSRLSQMSQKVLASVCSRILKCVRESEVPEEKVPVVECLDGFARITLKELAPIHFVKNGTLQNACSTRPRSGCRFGEKWVENSWNFSVFFGRLRIEQSECACDQQFEKNPICSRSYQRDVTDMIMIWCGSEVIRHRDESLETIGQLNGLRREKIFAGIRKSR